MMFLNSLKLFFSNFAQFWKSVAYKLVALALCTLLLLPFFDTFVQLDFGGLWTYLKQLFAIFPFANLGSWFNLLYNSILEFLHLFQTLLNINLFCFVYVLIVGLFIFPFLISLCCLPLGEVMYASMSSRAKKSFIGTFVKTIGKSCIFSFLKTMYELPFFALLAFCEYQLVLLATSSDVWIIVVPFLMVISYSVIIGLKNSFSCGWLPALVVLPCTVSSAFAKGFRAVSRRYFRVLSTTFCMAFLWCCVFYLFGIMSLFAILPISSMLLLIFDFVMFFSSQGMSFYVDYNTVLTPKKLEQTDKLRKAKDII